MTAQYTLGISQWSNIISDLKNPCLPPRLISSNTPTLNKWVKRLEPIFKEMIAYGDGLAYYATRLYAREDLSLIRQLGGTLQLEQTLSSIQSIANAVFNPENIEGMVNELTIDNNGIWYVGADELDWNKKYDVLLVDGTIIPNTTFSKLSAVNPRVTEPHDWPFIVKGENKFGKRDPENPDDLRGIYTALTVFAVRDTQSYGDWEVRATDLLTTPLNPEVDPTLFRSTMLESLDAKNPIVDNYAVENAYVSNERLELIKDIITGGRLTTPAPLFSDNRLIVRNPNNYFKRTAEETEYTVAVELAMMDGTVKDNCKMVVNSKDCGDLREVQYRTIVQPKYFDESGEVIDPIDVYGHVRKNV